ncbi:MAG: M23 family metallopeptidase [Propioniciclava sp.]
MKQSRRPPILGTEPPEAFIGFGQPILAPVSGIVEAVHDGERDHEARRSQLALIPYMLGQRGRLREGVGAIAGNHVIVKVASVYVAIVHLQRASIQVSEGDEIVEGEAIARCGNSGNSTQPHVHLQAMDGLDLTHTRGIPIAFRGFWEKPSGHLDFERRTIGIPNEGSVVQSELHGIPQTPTSGTP